MSVSQGCPQRGVPLYTISEHVRQYISTKNSNWASVSEPHTCDFNATFSLYTVDREIFALKIFRRINFRGVSFSSMSPPTKIKHGEIFYTAKF